MTKRDSRIDVMRGIAITLVVLEHALGNSLMSVQNIILSFHMPLFFMISGIFARNLYQGEFVNDLKKKVRSILIPQITLSVIAFFYNIVVSYWILHAIEISEVNYISYLFGYWFLHVMFQVSILWEILNRRIKNNGAIIYAALAATTVYLFLIPAGIKGPLYIAVTPVALGFYTLGFLLKQKGALKKKSVLVEAVLFVSVCVIGILNGRVLMYENQYGNPVLFLLTSIAGFYLVNDISYYLKNQRLLSWMGENSIIIYVLHFFIVQGIRGFMSRMVGGFSKSQMFGIVVFLLSYTIVLCMTWFCDKHLGILFGRSRCIRNGRK